MKEVKETVAQFVKYERNRNLLDNLERLWYNGTMKGGYKMKCIDIDEMIYGDDFDKHSTK